MKKQEIERAIEHLEHLYTNTYFETEFYKITTNVLQNELERLENKALSLEELVDMIGKPVWVEPYKEWGLVQSDDYVTDYKLGRFYVILSKSVSFTSSKSVKLNRLKLYKHKPKENNDG